MELWKRIQAALAVDGGLYVDAFALVLIVRLLAVLWGYPPVTGPEAGVWASVVSAYAYSNKKGGGSQ